MLDCWNQILGEITFENKPSEFHKLTKKVSRFVTEEKIAVYELENAYGYNRALAVWLLEKGCVVKGFLGDISRATALYFWFKYPSPECLQGKTAEELAAELRPSKVPIPNERRRIGVESVNIHHN